jgi:hypothetical protein
MSKGCVLRSTFKVESDLGLHKADFFSKFDNLDYKLSPISRFKLHQKKTPTVPQSTNTRELVAGIL